LTPIREERVGEQANSGKSEFESLLGMLKAMAHESRLRLLGILASRQCSVEELATMLGLRMPTISHHLASLREAGLVSLKKDGNTHLYRLDDVALAKLRKNFRSSGELAGIVDESSFGNWNRTVLRAFVTGNKLKEIPASGKKRQVVLRWLVEKLEPGRRYPERRLDEILQRHHPDSATLRRELVASKLLKRTRAGLYSRPDR
jgi:DNA-binding transcriptional ArsR family regulator